MKPIHSKWLTLGVNGNRKGAQPRAFAGLVGYRMFALLLILAQSVVITRVFGVEAFGVLSIAISVVAIVGMVASLGLDQVWMRDLAALGISKARTDPQFGGLRRLILRTVTPFVVLLTVAGGLAFGLIGLGGAYRVCLIAAWLMLPVLIVRKFIEAAALGAKRPGLSFTGSNIIFPGSMIVLAVALSLTDLALNVVILAWVYVAALAVSLLVLYLIARPQLGWILKSVPNPGKLDPQESRRTLKASLHLSLVTAGVLIGQNIDVLISGLVSSPETVAVVRILSRLGEAIAIFRAMALLQYKPYLAEAGMKGDTAGLQTHVRTMGRIYVLTGLPILIASCALAGPILSVYGSGLDGYEWALRVYMCAVFVSLLGSPASAALTMSGQERSASRALWVSLIFSAVGNVMLIPVLGALGSAFASLAAAIVVTGLSVYFTWSHLKVRTWSLLSVRL